MEKHHKLSIETIPYSRFPETPETPDKPDKPKKGDFAGAAA